LIEAINRGQKIVNYAGHGSVDVWRGGLLASNDAPALHNSEGLSLFVIMNCLNGYFTDPAQDSLAEALVRVEKGGAVAAWASSGMTLPDAQMLLNQELYRQLSSGGLTLGEAIRKAKAATGDIDARRTWILLGDPTMRVK
jgi:peptidase C25-like protein